MSPLRAEQVRAVLQLSASARLAHFVKQVADSEVAWGLWFEGWALMADDQGARSFPLWPARDYAELMRTGDWEGYMPAEIALGDLLRELLPRLEKEGTLVGVFVTPEGESATLPAPELGAALQAELDRWY